MWPRKVAQGLCILPCTLQLPPPPPADGGLSLLACWNAWVIRTGLGFEFSGVVWAESRGKSLHFLSTCITYAKQGGGGRGRRIITPPWLRACFSTGRRHETNKEVVAFRRQRLFVFQSVQNNLQGLLCFASSFLAAQSIFLSTKKRGKISDHAPLLLASLCCRLTLLMMNVKL